MAFDTGDEAPESPYSGSISEDDGSTGDPGDDASSGRTLDGPGFGAFVCVRVDAFRFDVDG